MSRRRRLLDRWVALRFINARKKKENGCGLPASQVRAGDLVGDVACGIARFGAWARYTDGAGSTGGRVWG